MPDVLAIATLIAFFSVAVLFVRACERIIGPDLEAEVVTADASSGEPDSGQPDPDQPKLGQVAA